MVLPISGQAVAVAKASPQPVDLNKNNIASFGIDFTGAGTVYLVDLTQQQQAGLFRTPETLFMDNSTNPNSVVVQVSITNQFFEIPPNSNGYYRLSSTPGSQITLTSVGGATSRGNIQIFDFPITPVVWYNTPGGVASAVTIADGASVTLGTKADAATTNPAAVASEISILKGILQEEVAQASNIVWTQTVVNLPAGVSTQILAANAARRALRWMNAGVNPVTVVPGAAAAVAGLGMNYGAAGGVGLQGGSDSFTRGEISASAFQAISTVGSSITVWEGV